VTDETGGRELAPNAPGCSVMLPELHYALASGRQAIMTTGNDGPCRFALFWFPFQGAPKELREAYNHVHLTADPSGGSVTFWSDAQQTWIEYTPHAGFVGADAFSFRLLPGNGLYEVKVQVSAPPAPAQSPEPDPSSLFVYFDFDQAVLQSAAYQALDVIGRQMQDPRFRDFVLQISGHTDGRGSDAYNLALSERRAEAVRSYLVGKFAINPQRVRSAAFGDRVLIDRADPFAGDNRRVHLALVRGLRASTVVSP